jgi:hypothetical protein
MLDHLGDASFPFSGPFVPLLLNNAAHDDPHFRQSAAYGLGVMALRGGAQYRPFVGQGLAVLYKTISSPDAFEPTYRQATENAMASILRIFQAGMGDRAMDSCIASLLDLPPMTVDRIEGRYVCGFLQNLLDTSDPVLKGVPRARERIAAWIATSRAAGVFEEQDKKDDDDDDDD